jgi:hypothetical protein
MIRRLQRQWPNQVAGANRRWRCQFRYRGSRRESAVAQLSALDGKCAHHKKDHNTKQK